MGRANVLTVCFLLAAVFLCLSPSLRNGFIGYDDPEYVTENAHVNTGLTAANVAWAFTAAHSSNWHPLTWLSHAMDCEWFGLNPARHHLTSLLLHAASTVMLFLWLSGATGSRVRAGWVALIFGIHPTHVESVAWVAERKDVLSAFFAMLTLLAYTAYARRPAIWRYALVVAWFAAGLMSKAMLVTLPALLLLLDWWPLARAERWGRLIGEKIPLLACSGLVAAAAWWAQRQNASVAGIDQLPIGLRLANAAVSYVRYLVKTAWPANLAVFYPYPPGGISAWKVAASVILLGAISWAAVAARGRCPWWTMGWFWYVVSLLPVIGIVQVGMQSVADRYLYLPMIGLLITAAWACGEVVGGSRKRARILAVAAGLVAAACGVSTWRQVHYWKDGVSLFTHALEVTEDNFVAHDNLAVELDRLGRFDEALAHYRETLRIKPGDRNGEQNYAQANFAKGERLLGQGAAAESLASIREGLRYRPRDALAHTYAGLALDQMQQPGAAMAEFRRGIEIDPGIARAHVGLGVILARLGQAEDAGREFEAAVRSDPMNVEAYYDLGLLRLAAGRKLEALESLERALRLRPDFAAAHAARAEALDALARYDEAWSEALAAGPAADAGLIERLRKHRGR